MRERERVVRRGTVQSKKRGVEKTRDREVVLLLDAWYGIHFVKATCLIPPYTHAV